MRVLVVFSSGDVGGAEISLARITSANSDKRIEYIYATYGSKGYICEFFENLGLNIVSFDHKLINLIKFIHYEKPNIVYIIGFRISVYLRFTKFLIPWVKLIHGVRWNPDSNSKLDKIFRISERLFSGLIDGYITNSKISAETLKKIGMKNIQVIHNGVFMQEKFKNKRKTHYKYITTIANVSKRKGYFEYLNVVDLVIKKNNKVKFLIIGKDYLGGRLQKEISARGLQNNISYIGFQRDVSKYLAKSHAFVLPSMYGEGCPTSILEAYYFSVPVVAYNIDGIQELVSNNLDGFLCKKGDYEEMCDAICRIYDNPKLGHKMGNYGYKKVTTNYTIHKAVEKHNKFFLGLKRK